MNTTTNAKDKQNTVAECNGYTGLRAKAVYFFWKNYCAVGNTKMTQIHLWNTNTLLQWNCFAFMIQMDALCTSNGCTKVPQTDALKCLPLCHSL